MKLLVLLSLLVSLSSCRTFLRKDYGLFSYEANYYTSEFQACGSTHQGLAICDLREGDKLSNINLKIQGYNFGTIKISSSECTVKNPLITYSNSQKVRIKLEGNAKRTCLVQFIVQPDYRNNNGLVLGDYKGAVLIKVSRKGSETRSKISKVRQEGKVSWGINLSSKKPVRVLFFSDLCNIQYDEMRLPEMGKIEVDLSDIADREIKTCILSGALVIDREVIRLSWLINVFSKEYERLPIPYTRVKMGKIYINSSPDTSVISLNRKFKIKKKGFFRFRKNRSNIIRVMTVKGRSRLGIWNKRKREFIWK